MLSILKNTPTQVVGTVFGPYVYVYSGLTVYLILACMKIMNISLSGKRYPYLERNRNIHTSKYQSFDQFWNNHKEIAGSFHVKSTRNFDFVNHHLRIGWFLVHSVEIMQRNTVLDFTYQFLAVPEIWILVPNPFFAQFFQRHVKRTQLATHKQE